jgi:hypothetical protein
MLLIRFSSHLCSQGELQPLVSVDGKSSSTFNPPLVRRSVATIIMPFFGNQQNSLSIHLWSEGALQLSSWETIERNDGFQSTFGQKERCNSDNLKRLVIKVCRSAFGKVGLISTIALTELWKKVFRQTRNPRQHMRFKLLAKSLGVLTSL